MNETYTTENLKKGTGVAFDWFGGKTIFSVEELEEMKSDDNIRKIYFNFDDSAIRRVK
jgi:hypothetical protein